MRQCDPSQLKKTAVMICAIWCLLLNSACATQNKADVRESEGLEAEATSQVVTSVELDRDIITIPGRVISLPQRDKVVPPDPLAMPAPYAAWQPMYIGVDYSRTRVQEPKPNVLHIVRVDLQANGVRAFVSPPAEDRQADSFDVRSMRTSTFLSAHGLQLAINGSPFAPVVLTEGQEQQVMGVSISNGHLYSQQRPGWGALVIGMNGRARIIDQPADITDAHQAIGGFGRILVDGRNVGGGDDRHPRTAVGVCETGRYLFLLVVDGRQNGFSEGATTGELGQWLLDVGAVNAVNLDGGGSTTLVVQGNDGQPKVVNRPIHLSLPGTERPSANHLGIFAKPLQ